MTKYSPFERPLADLTTADLQVLREVHEGWYVEYKREAPNAGGIAKSISAFANTHGGWLFYGVEEAAKDNAVAGAFPGIARVNVDAVLQRLRQAAASSISPTPHFETRVLWGPEAELGLAADCAVIVVWTPAGHNAPFLHKSGYIYRRVGDGSEPRPETDRHVLDQLTNRRKDLDRAYRRWLKRDLELSKAEEDRPFLRIFATPDPWSDQTIALKLNTQGAREIFGGMAKADESHATIPFDMVQRTATGYVARQLVGNDPQFLTTTWFQHYDPASEFIQPLNAWSQLHLRDLPETLAGYDHTLGFTEALAKQGYQDVRIIDLNFVFTSLIGFFHTQSLIDDATGHHGSLFVKVELSNVWRTLPFLDVESVVLHQVEHGVPMCMTDRVLTPPGRTPDSFSEIPTFDEVGEPKAQKFFRAMAVFELVCCALGIETGADWEPGPDGGISWIHADVFQASERAKRAQTLRDDQWQRRLARPPIAR